MLKVQKTLFSAVACLYQVAEHNSQNSRKPAKTDEGFFFSIAGFRNVNLTQGASVLDNENPTLAFIRFFIRNILVPIICVFGIIGNSLR